MPELLREAPPQDEFSSRGTSSHAVNPTPNPRDGDKVGLGSTGSGEEEEESSSRRQVLRSLTNQRDSPASRSFSLKVTGEESLAGRRFPLQRSSRRRNSRAGEMSSRMPQEHHGLEEDPAGRRGPLNDDGSASEPPRSQFRVNAECPRVVKLTDSEGNTSCDPTINSLREPEKLSRDSPLSPRGGSAIAERSFLESRVSGGEAVERSAQFEMVSGSDRRKRHSRPRKKENSRDVSMIHPFFSSQMLHKTHGFPSVATIPQKSREDVLVRIARGVPPLSNVEYFRADYENSANQSARYSLTALQDPSRLSLAQQPSVDYDIQSFVSTILKTLGIFVEVGRQVIDVLQKNAALVCTKDYLWTKFVKWIDT